MLEILKTYLRYFQIILWNWLEYFHEIWKLQKNIRKVNFGLILGKLWGKHRDNFKLLFLRKLRRILKMFLSSLSEIMKKFWRKVGEYLVKIFRHSRRKFRDIFVLIFWKTFQKFYGKREIILRKFWNNLEKS